MNIVVINEVSARKKNPDIIAALKALGRNDLNIINAGMTEKDGEPELTYIHTGFYAALLLNIGRADFIVGGCGTGQGFLNSIMQYPNVFCGLITNPLDAWLFSQINAGNAISLALNQGYGWASEVNLRFIFERLFSGKPGCGYPSYRAKSQAESRRTLEKISKITHVSFVDIINNIYDQIIKPVLDFPGALELIDIDSLEDEELKKALKRRARM
ncbi:TPA: ribose-5-phosphate isomerase [Candidatus Bathyarchaeota archaeon]|nr:ribose-5-phosphate isomerase [Candidatus Bathyarchaeota archaeon]